MADDFSKLSPEQLNKLSSTISEAKGLTDRQAEIIEKVLLGESKVNESRISHLKQFFDLYSRKLDEVARKQSDLNDTFLVLDNQKEYKPNSSNIGGSGNNGGGGNNSPTSGNSKPPSNSADRKNTWKTPEDARNKMREQADSLVKEFINDTSEYLRLNSDAQKEALLKNKNSSEGLPFSLNELKNYNTNKEIEQLKEHAQLKNNLQESMMNLELLRSQKETDLTNQVTEHRLSALQETVNAEIDAQTLINKLAMEEAYARQNPDEYSDLRVRQLQAAEDKKSLLELEQSKIDYITNEELKARRKNNGILKAEEAKRIQKEASDKFKADKKNLDKLTKERYKQEEKILRKKAKDNLTSDLEQLTGKGHTMSERFESMKNLSHNQDTGKTDGWKAVSAIVLAVSDLATKLENKVDEIAVYKGDIDTRLQGSSNEQSKGSYWDQLVKDMTSVGAINPYFKQETFANNIKDLVNRGIAFDLKQRAFLMTIQDKIATTFDVADGTLLRLIRIQQADSTAGRLGMESVLNTFLNNMYETSEYLSDVAQSVRGSLEEMQSLMEGAEATEVEYQIQKWLGSLYSVGMSQSAVQSISDTLGKIAAGQIEGITGGGAGNLLIMAANDAGLSIADILINGIDSSNTNKLLKASVDYLAELAKESKDNKVVQQQLAEVFGVRASDLKAATNLSRSTSSVFNNNQTYDSLMGQLMSMASSIANRTSLGEMMTNIWDNGQYSLAGSMATSPVSYFIYKMAKVVDEAAGGIDLPFVNVMGFGVDLNTTVSDLMRVAAVGGSLLGNLGPLISGLGNSFSTSSMLNTLGIKSGGGLTITPRGSGGILSSSSSGQPYLSASGHGTHVGNASGSDVKNATLKEAEDSKKQQMIEAKEEAESNDVNVLNNTVIKIYELLDEVAHGSGSFKVQVEGYGLTKSSGGSNLGKALAGVNALGDTGVAVRNNGASIATAGVNSTDIGGHINLGGWTTSS